MPFELVSKKVEVEWAAVIDSPGFGGRVRLVLILMDFLDDQNRSKFAPILKDSTLVASALMEYSGDVPVACSVKNILILAP